MLFVIWFAFAFLVGCHAHRGHENGFVWFVVAIIFSPIIAFGLLHAMTRPKYKP